MYQDVVLYYPNKWRSRASQIAPEEDLAFNWFICSKKYKDPKTNLEVAKILRSSKFYDRKTGKTLIPSPKYPEIIIVINGTPQDVKLHNYQGYATVNSKKSCPKNFICNEIGFHFLEGVLTSPVREEECELIRYAKSNYLSIKSIVKNFPNPEEIDEAIKKYSSESVCQILYQYLSHYFSDFE